jgi:hypothetical protein
MGIFLDIPDIEAKVSSLYTFYKKIAPDGVKDDTFAI